MELIHGAVEVGRFNVHLALPFRPTYDKEGRPEMFEVLAAHRRDLNYYVDFANDDKFKIFEGRTLTEDIEWATYRDRLRGRSSKESPQPLWLLKRATLVAILAKMRAIEGLPEVGEHP